jgi:type IV secretory pathway VirB3-like protein
MILNFNFILIKKFIYNFIKITLDFFKYFLEFKEAQFFEVRIFKVSKN